MNKIKLTSLPCICADVFYGTEIIRQWIQYQSLILIKIIYALMKGIRLQII